ncbi:hypothetical protein ANCCAN_06943 [Ancylostoma caninum]|uniref:Uncharacterized protein n=1 Tax=Ancylostoma caninum TaxID=29170 RepID=A0A368GRL2_ANCCA|nr:hypothetical protein ANCCAN_06943 [Ancylostoma caninum]
MMGIPAMVSSVAELSSSPGVPLHGVLCTSSKAKAKVDLDDSFDAAAFDENFSPSKIELPDLTTWGQAPSSSRLIIEQTQPGTSQFSRAPVSVLGPLQGAGADQNRALTQTSGKPAAVDPSLIPSVPGQDVLRELTAKVADRNESGVVRLRPQQSLHFIPNAGPRPVGSDPFEISTSVVNAVRRERYNDILEKKSVASRPHSSILPTSAPISIFGNAIHQRSDSANAAVTANTRTQQPVISGESSTNGHNYRSIFSVADKPAPSAQLIDKKGREHEDVMLPSPSHVCSSAQVTEKAVAAPSSSAMGRVTSNGSANSHNHVKLPNSASDESRKKRVEIAISSALPPPSKLFFGNSHGSTSQLTKSSGHGTTTESSVRAFQ